MPMRVVPSSSSPQRRLRLAALLPLLLVACGGEPPPDPALAAAPPPAVVAVPAVEATIADRSAFVGRVAARDRVDLRARVEGFLKERRFEEGQQVAVGDLLFVIEPELYQSQVAQREADLTAARADEENARAQLARGEELLRSKNIAASKVDELRAAESVAKARIAQAEAAVAAARLNLGYTQITAPVAGRIGISRFSVGSLVGPGSDPLATIVSADPIEIKFPITQRDLLTARREAQARGGPGAPLEVLARLPDGSLYERKGQIDFVDVTTDPGTDAVTVRAVFPNPERILTDGQFIGVLLQSGEPQPVITVPQPALQLDQQGVYVLIVDAENRAQIRRIETGALDGARVVVKSGLAAGDLVITEGAQKVRPGQRVSATPPTTFADPDAPAATGAGPASGAATGPATDAEDGAGSGNGAEPPPEARK